MSAEEKINLKVKNTAKPIVVELAKENVLSSSREIVPQVVNNTISDFTLLKLIPKEPGISNAFDCIPDDSVSLEAASHEPFDIYDDESIMRQNIRNSNPVKKMMANKKKLTN